MRKIFLVSLPRSGSTLVQNILMSDPCARSISENWFLLPLLTMERDSVSLSKFGSKAAALTFAEVVSTVGRTRIDEILRETSDKIYQELYQSLQTGESSSCDDPVYIDKTPRYFEILPEIDRLFSDRHIVLISRNPFHIIDSYQKTFGGKFLFKMPIYKGDLQAGFRAMSRFYASSMHRKDVVHVNYNSLVKDPSEEMQRLGSCLELRFSSDTLARNLRKRTGAYGDPSFGKYSRIQINEKRIDIVTLLWIHFNKKRLGIKGYCRAFGIECEIPKIRLSWSSPIFLLTWPLMELIAIFNLKAVYAGFRSGVFFR